MYGVKMDKSRDKANAKQKIGSGRFSPWILEPSQSKRTGQNTNMISGVPVPINDRKIVESVIKIDASKDTLFLNQRFRIKIKRKPSKIPMIMFGSLIANGVRPKARIETFCKRRYGRSTKSPLKTASGSRLYELTADSISAVERFFWAIRGTKKSKPTKANPSRI